MKIKYGFLKGFVPILIFLMCLSFFSCSPGYYDEDDNIQLTTSISLEEDKDDSASELLTSYEEVADYIKQNGQLPDNFITKSEARDLGWNANEGNLAEVAPGKSIGGDIFYNNEGKLPKVSGRIYYECDIDYVSGYRGESRIVFSNDGLIFKTEDHYQTFTEIK